MVPYGTHRSCLDTQLGHILNHMPVRLLEKHRKVHGIQRVQEDLGTPKGLSVQLHSIQEQQSE